MSRKASAILGVLLFALPFLPIHAFAQENPFQIAFIGPTLQLVDDDEDVKGIRLNLPYGVNRNVTGLDLGFINHTKGEFSGVEFGIVNLTEGPFAGWQNGIINIAQDRFTGLQFDPLTLANVVGTGEGAQIAWGFNKADYLYGFQLALVNIAEDMEGLQVGLINIIRSKPTLWILPLVNWKFE
jgi:hypothetical protein